MYAAVVLLQGVEVLGGETTLRVTALVPVKREGVIQHYREVI